MFNGFITQDSVPSILHIDGEGVSSRFTSSHSFKKFIQHMFIEQLLCGKHWHARSRFIMKKLYIKRSFEKL